MRCTKDSGTRLCKKVAPACRDRRCKVDFLIVASGADAVGALSRRCAMLVKPSAPTRDRSMATKVVTQHPASGLTRNGYFGFSWTYLIFGWWVPLFRDEDLEVVMVHFFFTIVTLGLWQLIVAFLYNRQYMTRMLEQGFVLKDDERTMAEARRVLGIASDVYPRSV